MSFRNFFATLLVFVSGAQVATAQVNTATSSGTVRDESGAVLPGAAVTVENQDTGISRSLTTNETGRYTAPALGLGNYQVSVQLPGFQNQVRSGIALTVGREAVVDFTLAVGAVTQTVEVKGEAPLVELTNATMGGLVDDRTIREMPLNSRSWDTLAYTVPGVVKYTSADGGFNSGSGNNKFSVAAHAAIPTASCLTGLTSMIRPIPRRVVRRAQTSAWMRSRNSRSSPRRSARNTAGLPAQWSPPLPEAARTTCTAHCSNSIGTAHSMPEPSSTLKTTTVTAGPICRHSIGTNLAEFWVDRLKRTRPSSSAGMKGSAH